MPFCFKDLEPNELKVFKDFKKNFVKYVSDQPVEVSTGLFKAFCCLCCCVETGILFEDGSSDEYDILSGFLINKIEAGCETADDLWLQACILIRINKYMSKSHTHVLSDDMQCSNASIYSCKECLAPFLYKGSDPYVAAEFRAALVRADIPLAKFCPKHNKEVSRAL